MMLSLITMSLGKLFGMGETWVNAKQEREKQLRLKTLLP